MSEAAEDASPSPPVAQPFTFSGVAAFASNGPGRLLLVELLTALVISGSIVIFLQRAYAPVILQAIGQMPETAKIARGRLTGVTNTVIAETKLLAIAITPEPAGVIGQSADVQIQFRPANFRVGTVFRPDWGWEFDYGADANLDLSRSYLEPWWGAWRPVWLAAIGVLVIACLFLIWAMVAVIYTLPAKIIAWFADRQLTWGGAWRLGSAAMLSGALLVAFSIFLYGAQWIDLVGLAFFYVTHLLVGWVYLFGGALVCPRIDHTPPTHNPFVS